MNRRHFLQISAFAELSATHSLPVFAAAKKSSKTASFSLDAQQASVNIVGPDFQATDLWSFNSTVPGSPIRLRQGESLKALVIHSLKVPTAVHWHGIRLPNAMDGVLGLTQSAISPGESFDYSFTLPDPGTYWYHSYLNASEQVGRGLYAPLIIEEKEPPVVDVKAGTTVKIMLENLSTFPHPKHLHGHHMKLLSIDGKPMASPRWVDSPLLMPRQRMELAFAADNLGKRLFHCHALEHHDAGLGALVNIA